jgi:transcriptional regulator with XRE-family HTH domain
MVSNDSDYLGGEMGSNELGAFLRASRARVRPTDVGLPAGTGIRRTPGLRREELAALAGVSIDYYIRLEQGKETNPSPAVLEALSGALRMGSDEREHLYGLADHAAGRVPAARPAPAVVRPGILQLLNRVRPCPAYVLSTTSDILAANPEALALFAGISEWPASRRNTIRYVFLHPAARGLFGDWEKAARTSAAHLRSLIAADPGSVSLASLVEELSGSADFARLWNRYDVEPRHGDLKLFHHPEVGDLTLSFEVLHLSPERQRMTVYQAAPGTADHDALVLLSLTTSDDQR